MNILGQKLSSKLCRLLNSSRQGIYIHLKDHDKKINPEKGRLHLSYMEPQKIIEDAPKNEPFSANLKPGAREALQKQLFEDYKQKILEGRIDE